jgi:hypothetical protein
MLKADNIMNASELSNLYEALQNAPGGANCDSTKMRLSADASPMPHWERAGVRGQFPSMFGVRCSVFNVFAMQGGKRAEMRGRACSILKHPDDLDRLLTGFLARFTPSKPPFALHSARLRSPSPTFARHFENFFSRNTTLATQFFARCVRQSKSAKASHTNWCFRSQGAHAPSRAVGAAPANHPSCLQPIKPNQTKSNQKITFLPLSSCLLIAILLLAGCSSPTNNSPSTTATFPKTTSTSNPSVPLTSDAPSTGAQPLATNVKDTQPPPGDPDMEIQMGVVLAQQHRIEDAILHYHEAVRLYREQLRRQPNSPDNIDRLAWLLATNPNAEIRDGKQALGLARESCDLTGNTRPAFELTLAAAYAETGQFDDAINTARQAENLASATKDSSSKARAQELLKLFRSHHPYHEPF